MEDSLMEQTLWKEGNVVQKLRECVCLKFIDGSNEAIQFKEFCMFCFLSFFCVVLVLILLLLPHVDPFEATPTVYFIGLQRKALLYHSGLLSTEAFIEKYTAARELLSKQVTNHLVINNIINQIKQPRVNEKK